jgi:triacylglycerol lipase
MARVIQDVGEQPLVLHSNVREPLERMSFLQRALVLAELAMVSYNDEAEARRAAEAIGFDEAELFDNDELTRVTFRPAGS